MAEHFGSALTSAATEQIRRYAKIIAEQAGALDPEDDPHTIASALATITMAADKVLDYLPEIR